MSNNKEETGEHIATNKDVAASNKKWGLTQIAAVCVAFSTIGAFTTGFWSTAVQAGGRGHFATVEQTTAISQKIETLDAGAAKKEDVQRLEEKVDELSSEVKKSNDKMDELKNILIKQKGR